MTPDPQSYPLDLLFACVKRVGIERVIRALIELNKEEQIQRCQSCTRCSKEMIYHAE